MQNISELIFRALAATTTTTASTLKVTARKATLAAAAAVVATSASISTTTHTARLASAAAATAFASSNAVSWAAQNFYDEVDVYFATAYINDSWIAINNNNSTGNGGGNNMNMNVNVNSSIIGNNDNSRTSISYYDDINHTTLINDTGVVKGVYGHINDTNATIANEVDSEELAAFIKMLALSILLGLMILITIIGNVFVIAAIMLERNLQNVANYLVASLAVADLFVACLVMPLGAVYEISQGWILGPELCDIWTCCDVLCCTASILHLVAIASDRYWTVTNIDYTNFRTPRRVFFMILLVWLAAVVVSLAPQFGWKDPEYMERIKQQKCMVSQDVGYQIFATCSTFYVPLLVILVLYWKIYKIARKRIQRRRHRPHFGVLQANNTNHQTEKQLKKLKKQEKKAQKLRDQQMAAEASEQQQQQEMLEKGNLPQKSKRQKGLKICFGISSSAATTSDATQIPTIIDVPPTATTTSTTTTITTTGAAATATATKTLITTTVTTNGHNGVTITTATTMDCAATGGVADNRPLAAMGVHCLGPEDLEYSTSNFDSKSHGTEVTTISSDADEQTPQSNSEIITISHQVASSHIPKQQHEKQNKQETQQDEQKEQQQEKEGEKSEQQEEKEKVQQQQQQLESNTADMSLNVPAGGISSEPNSGEGGVNKLLTSIPNPLSKIAKRRQLLEARRERKAAQTLAIITGAFVVCWLPFFVMALLLPLCKDCDVDPIVASVFLWLGYFNSTLNPVIYTVFNPEFRRAFQRIVYGRNSMPHAAASRKM